MKGYKNKEIKEVQKMFNTNNALKLLNAAF